MSVTLPQIGSTMAEAQDAGQPPVAARGKTSQGASPAAESAQPEGWQPPQLSTAIRIDDRRRIYYEVINDHTGQVVLEIPPETVRSIGEGINQFLETLHPTRSVDVKS
ncbi:MAG TPA: hypothetical protein VFA67_05550 [Candidatus Sulfotelmatobacter sp.]|jgi:hypothetical protein|nr:hypothetical protein [Candidatus Sulfotelmatobacter sp.]